MRRKKKTNKPSTFFNVISKNVLWLVREACRPCNRFKYTKTILYVLQNETLKKSLYDVRFAERISITRTVNETVVRDTPTLLIF